MDDQKMDKKLPETVGEAVEKLISGLPQIDKVRIANRTESDLVDLHFSLGMHIRNEYGLWAGNEGLLESCKQISGEQNLHVDDVAAVIIKELWERLKESNQIRLIK